MVIDSAISNTVFLTLGKADVLNLPDLVFKSIRKNTRKEVIFDPFPVVVNNQRWAEGILDGSLFQEGEHNYFISDDSGNLIEQGILIVKNGATKIPEFQSSLEGEKGEHS